jgi:hypothetical protein
MGLSCVRKYQTKYTLYLERLFQALERQSYHAFLGQTWLPAFRKHKIRAEKPVLPLKGPKYSSGPRHHHTIYLNVVLETIINVNDRPGGGPGQRRNNKALFRDSGLSICLFCTIAMKEAI